MGEKTCTSCGKTTYQDYSEFKCPNCAKQTHIRCKECRAQQKEYTCQQCGFQGP